MKLPLRQKFSFLAISACCMLAEANPVDQAQIQFTKGLQGTFHADWEGVAGRTYFMQFSMNLIDWQYAPFMHFGEGGHHRGIHSDADKFFLRLHYGNFPGVNNLDDAMNADFDGDGISNIFEVTYGYNPFSLTSTQGGADASLDPDGDGLGNHAEINHGLNPMNRDNPQVMLDVVAE